MKTGYGVMRIQNKPVLAHRVSYTVFIGNVGDLHVCHTCDNPGCVNPKHLFLGTHKDNMQDKVKKGRCQDHKGEAHPCAILTEKDVRFIRASEDSNRVLGAYFGVDKSTIGLVKNGKTWSHIE